MLKMFNSIVKWIHEMLNLTTELAGIEFEARRRRMRMRRKYRKYRA